MYCYRERWTHIVLFRISFSSVVFSFLFLIGWKCWQRQEEILQRTLHSSWHWTAPLSCQGNEQWMDISQYDNINISAVYKIKLELCSPIPMTLIFHSKPDQYWSTIKTSGIILLTILWFSSQHLHGVMDSYLKCTGEPMSWCKFDLKMLENIKMC